MFIGIAGYTVVNLRISVILTFLWFGFKCFNFQINLTSTITNDLDSEVTVLRILESKLLKRKFCDFGEKIFTL